MSWISWNEEFEGPMDGLERDHSIRAPNHKSDRGAESGLMEDFNRKVEEFDGELEFEPGLSPYNVFLATLCIYVIQYFLEPTKLAELIDKWLVPSGMNDDHVILRVCAKAKLGRIWKVLNPSVRIAVNTIESWSTGSRVVLHPLKYSCNSRTSGLVLFHQRELRATSDYILLAEFIAST
ncbi:hypothetical protein RSAG8_09197, partial [Rhizoctonia solani AG-8 WAC10335]